MMDAVAARRSLTMLSVPTFRERGCWARAGAEAAQRLFGQVLYAQLARAVLGIDELAASFDPAPWGGISI
jgi:hypothetical protein